MDGGAHEMIRARPERIRTLMLIQSFRPNIGGGELQLERLLPYLAERGIHSEVLTRAFPGTRRREPISGGTIVRTALAGESPLASIVYVVQSLTRTARRRRSVDVVHAHGALSPGTIALGARALGLPCITTVFSTGVRGDLTRLERKPMGRVRLRGLLRHSWFIALSDEVKQELESRGVSSSRILRIPNGVDCRNTFRPASPVERGQLRARLEIPQDAYACIYVGRLHPKKRVDTLVQAVTRVPEARLLVVGDGTERAKLEALTRRSGAANRVTFVGFTHQVADYLRACDVFVFPSKDEGMSNALIEAMACGLPCVATAGVGGVRELLSDGRGIVVGRGYPAEWSTAIHRLAVDASLRESMGKAAARFAESALSLDAVADSLLHAYQHVIRADAGPGQHARGPGDRRPEPLG
jgi:glycosyltransferase involved in cell wall biosynthesis